MTQRNGLCISNKHTYKSIYCSINGLLHMFFFFFSFSLSEQYEESWVNNTRSIYFSLFLINFAHYDIKNQNSSCRILKLYLEFYNVKIFGMKAPEF